MAAPTTSAKPAEIVKPVRKPRAKAPENESKADKFKRLANHRVPRAVKLMRNIGNLSNRNQYEFTDEQKNAVIMALTREVEVLKNTFNGQQKEKEVFRL